jgi:hypothetical protein
MSDPLTVFLAWLILSTASALIWVLARIGHIGYLNRSREQILRGELGRQRAGRG